MNDDCFVHRGIALVRNFLTVIHAVVVGVCVVDLRAELIFGEVVQPVVVIVGIACIPGAVAVGIPWMGIGQFGAVVLPVEDSVEFRVESRRRRLPIRRRCP